MNRLKNKLWIESGSPIRNELNKKNTSIKFSKVRAIIIDHVNTEKWSPLYTTVEHNISDALRDEMWND